MNSPIQTLFQMFFALFISLSLSACGGGGGGGGGGGEPTIDVVAKIDISNTSPRITEDVTFSASQSTGEISAYSWAFDTVNTAAGVSTTKAFATAGVVSVTLTVTGTDGTTDTETESLTVRGANQLPTASFTSTPIQGRSPLTVDFDASASSDSDGSISSYSWDFGDGSNATGATASKEFSTQNTYVVTLTVTDNEGESGTATDSIVVLGDNIPPIGTFTATPLDNGQVQFDATSATDSDGTIASYAWDFGDGSNSTDATVTHTFDLAAQPSAVFSVSLQVVDNEGTINQENAASITAYSNVVKIVEIGDSITHGQQDNFPTGEIYPTYRYPLWKKIVEQNKFANFIGGNQSLRNLSTCPESACADVTTNDGSGRFYTFDQNHQATWGIKASQVAANIDSDLSNSEYDNGIDVALIHLGTNELLQSEPASNASTAIQSIINSLKAKSPSIKILLARIIPLHSSQTGWDQVDTLNGLIDSIASGDANVFTVNHNAVVSTSELRDSVHPDHTGEQDMANEWYTELTNNSLL